VLQLFPVRRVGRVSRQFDTCEQDFVHHKTKGLHKLKGEAKAEVQGHNLKLVLKKKEEEKKRLCSLFVLVP
jgi:hypothetical protein